MYIHREIETKLASYLQQFKCVLVTGPRQSGKTTMLTHELVDKFEYVTLDDFDELHLAAEDPGAFLSASRTPIIIDEAQLAPEIFRQVKFVVDSVKKPGSVVLTGSQTYNLMQGVSESLAGRVGILELPTLSLRELSGNLSGQPYIPRRATNDASARPKGLDLWEHIQRGSMPRLQEKGVDWHDFYSSYVRSYLERDVRQLVNVRNERTFYRFVVAAAARTGQLLNASDIASTVGVDVKTVQEWLSVLQAGGIVHILQPFWVNTNKRLAKTPKLYFMDTGLACHLTGWNTAEQLKRGAMAGHMFETFVVSEVLKSFMNAGRDTRTVYFYRDARKREIDLLIQDGRTLHPVEIKAAVNVTSDSVKNFSVLDGFTDFEIGTGHVICQTEKPHVVCSNVLAISPWEI